MLDLGAQVITLVTVMEAEAISGMIQKVKPGGRGGDMALVVKSEIREAYHAVDRKETTMRIMEKNEADMKVQGGHQVRFGFFI